MHGHSTYRCCRLIGRAEGSIEQQVLLEVTTAQLLTLGNPAISLLFSCSFLCAWIFNRRRRYLLLLCLSYLSFGLGALVQILAWPVDPGSNNLLSATLYVSSAVLLTEGILRRCSLTQNKLYTAACAAALLGGLSYFYYVDDDLALRTYILNLGIGLLLVGGASRMRRMRRWRTMDRAVFWVFLAVALSFFPRTWLTALSVHEGSSVSAFANSTFWIVLQLSLVVCSVILALTLLAASMVDIIDSLRRDRDMDALTGLLNRRGFDERAGADLLRHLSSDMTVLVCDIDHFKAINDTYGHAAGDAVLQGLGQIVLEAVKHAHVAGRVGGEEFAILLFKHDAVAAHAFANRLRLALMQACFDGIPANQTVTLSIGISVRRPRDTLSAMMQRADTLLYRAKSAGRNRVCAEDLALRSNADARTETA